MAGDALKATDATWDEDVMKASELVMVDFWAVWCGPCQMVAPIVDELATEYAGKIKVNEAFGHPTLASLLRPPHKVIPLSMSR